MSRQILLQCFHAGEPAGIPRAALRVHFPIVNSDSDLNCWLVRYDWLSSCAIVVTPLGFPNDQWIESLCIHQPCRGMRLWDGIFSIMQLGPVVLSSQGKAPLLVADESVIRHVPAGFLESHGEPVRIKSGREIFHFFESAGPRAGRGIASGGRDQIEMED